MPRQRPAEVSPVMSASELANALRADRHTVIDSWVPQGCPVARQADRAAGVSWGFRLADVVDWLVRRGGAEGGGREALDYRAELARKAAADADMAEMERDQMRGRLVEVEDVGAEVEDANARVRARLLALPADLAMRVQHLTDLQAIERAIKDGVCRALDELSRDADEDDGAAGQAEGGGDA